MKSVLCATRGARRGIRMVGITSSSQPAVPAPPVVHCRSAATGSPDLRSRDWERNARRGIRTPDRLGVNDHCRFWTSPQGRYRRVQVGPASRRERGGHQGASGSRPLPDCHPRLTSPRTEPTFADQNRGRFKPQGERQRRNPLLRVRGQRDHASPEWTRIN
jgi:hypothetical protein